MILAKKPFKKTSEFVNDTVEAMIPTSTEAKIQLRGGSIAIVVGVSPCLSRGNRNLLAETDSI